VCSLLACVKFGDFLEKGQHARPEMLLSAPGTFSMLTPIDRLSKTDR